jgi:hypothetical protein
MFIPTEGWHFWAIIGGIAAIDLLGILLVFAVGVSPDR